MRVGLLFLVLWLFSGLQPALAASGASSPIASTGAVTSQPIGHHEFCKHHRPECGVTSQMDERVHLTEATWGDLVAVNNAVNSTIIPATDLEVWGENERWEYPTSRGDCDDMVLLKRRDLLQLGWPAGALLITVVLLPNGDGHAVLTVITDRGDVVLDNLVGEIKLWNEIGYRFVKRQSQFDAGQWVSVVDDRDLPAGASTGSQITAATDR